MAEPAVFTYSFKELAALLVKERELHEGLWGIYLKFGIGGANAGPDDSSLCPTAVVPILEIGIQKMQKASNLTVDANEVNPRKLKKAPK